MTIERTVVSDYFIDERLNICVPITVANAGWIEAFETCSWYPNITECKGPCYTYISKESGEEVSFCPAKELIKLTQIIKGLEGLI